MELDTGKLMAISLFLIIISLIAIGSASAYDGGNDNGSLAAIDSSTEFSIGSNEVGVSDSNLADSSISSPSNDNSPIVSVSSVSNDNSPIVFDSSSSTEYDFPDDVIIVRSHSSKGKLSSSSNSNSISDANSNSSSPLTLTPSEQFSEDIKNYNGGTVYLSEDIVLNKTITINTAMVIDGRGHSISSNGVRIFTVNSNLVLKNIVFKNAASTNGGAIYSTAKLTLSNCQFLNNKATSNGGAVYSTANLIIEKCKFNGNQANRGGAVYSTGEVEVKGSEFTNNKALKSGGAIFVKHKSTISNSLFSGNNALSSGGALYASDKLCTVSNCRFEKNSVTSNSNKVKGGAIFANCSTKITDSVFESNFCRYTKGQSKTYQSSGGAIFYNDGSHELIDSVFNGNYVDNDGGAIFVYSNVNKFIVNRCSFNNNKAYYEDGGAISTAAKNTQITNSNFIGNFANEDGGAIDTFSLTKSKVNVKISNCYFKSNMAYKAAGAVYLGIRTTRNILNSRFLSNKASVGGVFYMESGKTTIKACVFKSNAASKITSFVALTKGFKVVLHSGGVIFNNASTLQLLSSTFRSNSAKYGGAIFNKGKVTLKNTKFYYNKATFGGSLYTTFKKVNIYRNSFSSNKATVNGGAFYVDTGSVNLYSSTLKSNKASANGGALYLVAGAMKSSSCTIKSNKASSRGGALYLNNGKMKIYSSSLKSNKASVSGGSLYLRYGNYYSKGSKYYSNKAKYNGGAILAYSGKITLKSNRFKSNRANRFGGAIYLKYPKLNNKTNKFISNKAKKYPNIYDEKLIKANNSTATNKTRVSVNSR